jgi:hypothetical protein
LPEELVKFVFTAVDSVDSRTRFPTARTQERKEKVKLADFTL